MVVKLYSVLPITVVASYLKYLYACINFPLPKIKKKKKKGQPQKISIRM
jgi:hypothetical protein